MNRAPIVINFIIACHCTPDPENDLGSAHWDSPAGRETRRWLLENGLIDDKNRATERGAAWVRFICSTPLPEAKWVLPERNPA